MDEERWQHLQDLFLALLEREPAARKAFLDQATVGDAVLRDELSEMLAAHERGTASGGVEGLLLGAATPQAPELAGGVGEGGRVGPYRLLRKLGAGGMGEVFEAERADGQFRQRVALKLLRAGREDPSWVSRFRFEREILARLEHPSIARLIDGGVTERGLPYLAMELVRGVPITEHCDRDRLSVVARIRLFQAICRAVQVAHQNLVVHRDLKPSNILVNERGEIKLLDFGIAKLLEDGAGDLANGATHTLTAAMTPAFASPEQVRRGAVTTSTDVYALGLLLYEILTGRRAQRVEDLSPVALERLVCETEPARASIAVSASGDGSVAIARLRGGLSPERLSRALAGDLDTIVATAMQKEPGRRYASAERLADDLERHLVGLPVLARRDTALYRAGKFARRHRWGLLAASALALLLVGASVVTTLQARAVASERDVARAERDKAQEVTRFLFELFEANAFSEGKNRDTMTLRELLESSEQQVRASFGEQPTVQATLFNLLARLQLHLGHLEAARRLAEEGLALRERARGERHVEVAESLDNLATVAQALGDYDRAEALFRRALAIREEHYGREHVLVAETMNNLSGLLGERGDEADEQEEGALQREALAIQVGLLGDDDLEVARSLNNLAVSLYHRGGPAELTEAADLFRQALEIRRRHLGSDHPIVANTVSNLANILHDQGDLDGAEQGFREAIQIWTDALGPDHPQLSSGLFGLAELLEDRGDFEGASAALVRSLEIDAKALPPGHPYLEDGRRKLAEIHAAWGRPLPAGY